MHSPVVAMLWENWRLTQAETAQRLAQGIILTSAVLVGVAAFGTVGHDTVRLALGLLVFTYMPLWISVARLNGGRFMDGYRPGYPFYFLYTRPVPTFVLVGAPMAYLTASAVVAYLVSALVLRATFGYPFPLLPVAVCIAVFHITQWAAQWGTSSKVVQWLGSMSACTAVAVLAVWRAYEWPARLHFSAGDYAVLAAIGVTAFGLTVVGVARQRRGDARAAIRRNVEWRGFLELLAGLFRFPCPISSATRAQIWLDLRTSGAPVLAIGLALAIVVPSLFVATTQLDIALSGVITRPATRVVAVVVAMFALPAVLILGGNAFGIRARQGRSYASVFDATQACATARLAGLKVLVRSVCLLAALVAVGASVWTSASVIPFDVLDDNDAFIEKSRSPLSAQMRVIQAGVEAMRSHELLSLAFVALIAVTVMVALRASLTALRARYPRHVNVARAALLVHVLVLVALTMVVRRGLGAQVLADTMLAGTKWAVIAALALATIYLLWTSLVERLLTLRSVGVLLLTWLTFAAAWATVLRADGVQLVLRVLARVQLTDLPATDVMWMLWPMLLLLTVSVLTPWSLSRIRHT